MRLRQTLLAVPAKLLSALRRQQHSAGFDAVLLPVMLPAVKGAQGVQPYDSPNL